MKTAQELASHVGPLGTLIQHAVFNHLTDLTAFLRAGDFSNVRHDRISIESVAKTLVGLGVQENSAIGPHMPKQRVGQRSGRNPVHRLGSASSTVSSKTPRKCGFCKPQGFGANDSHRNQISCPVKASFGECIKISGANGAKAMNSCLKFGGYVTLLC